MKALCDIWAAGEKAVVNGKVWNVELGLDGRCVHLWREVYAAYYYKGGFRSARKRIVQIDRPLDFLAESIKKA